jgi:hypothetical protein
VRFSLSFVAFLNGMESLRFTISPSLMALSNSIFVEGEERRPNIIHTGNAFLVFVLDIGDVTGDLNANAIHISYVVSTGIKYKQPTYFSRTGMYFLYKLTADDDDDDDSTPPSSSLPLSLPPSLPPSPPRLHITVAYSAQAGFPTPRS